MDVLEEKSLMYLMWGPNSHISLLITSGSVVMLHMGLVAYHET